jgi:prephenate dehydrogenase
MSVLFHRLLIVGVGLIGGSLGLAAKARGLVDQVVGFGRTEANLKIALDRGLIDAYTFDPAEAARGTDCVLLAVPVQATGPVMQQFLPYLSPGCIVTDAGSVKAPVVATLESLVPDSLPCVAAHPIAGTENAGAGAAFETLFEGRLCVLTPTTRTNTDALARVRALWEGVGMRVEEMDAEVHDRILAQVSHLPHLIAFSVINGLLQAFPPSTPPQSEQVDPLVYAGSAFADLTRVAASPVEMWRDICLENRDALLAAISGFEAALTQMKAAVSEGDGQALSADITRAREERQRLTRLREKE